MRRLLCSALSFALVPAVAGRTTADDDAKAIITKAIEAHGGKDNLDKFKASKSTGKGTISIGGMEAEFTIESASQFPDKRKSTIKLEIMGMAVTVEQVMNGDKIKMTFNGNEVPVTDAQKADLKTEQTMMKVQRLTPLLTDKSLEVKSLGESKINGKAVLGIAVTGKGTKEVKVFFDKTTHLMSNVEFMASDMGGGEVKREITVSDYKDVQGVKISTKTSMTNDGKKFLDSSVSETKLLEKLDDKEFSD